MGGPPASWPPRGRCLQVARGRAIIPANKRHLELEPCGGCCQAWGGIRSWLHLRLVDQGAPPQCPQGKGPSSSGTRAAGADTAC